MATKGSGYAVVYVYQHFKVDNRLAMEKANCFRLGMEPWHNILE